MKKILLILLFYSVSVFAGTGGTKTVIEAGGDYPTVALWQTGEVGVLQTSAYCLIQGTWTNSAGAITITGWTTFSTATVTIQTQGTARHAGVWNNTCHRFVQTINGSVITVSGCKFITLDGLQIYNSGTGYSMQGISDGNSITGAVITISNCIIKCDDSASNTRGIAFEVSTNRRRLVNYNNIIYGWNNGLYQLWTVSASTVVNYNNTISSCATGILSIIGWQQNTAYYSKNNLIQFCPTCFNDQVTMNQPKGTNSQSNNCTTDATGSTNYTNQTATFTAYQLFNFHLLSADTTAQARGTSLTADPIQAFSTDIDGGTRPTNWSIGADDIPAAVSTRKKRCIADIDK